MDKWEEKRILILGTTYPSYSNTYTENVCTGGIEEDTLRMVRIHPVPHRYLESDQRFKAFQWIRARVMQHPHDPRPESLRIDPVSIELEDVIPPEQHDLRRSILERSPHVVASVEELRFRNKRDGTSLGILKPKTIEVPRLAKRTPAERTAWLQKETAVLSQEDFFGVQLKPLDFPELKFIVGWHCNDAACDGHEMSLLEWGVHELARKYKSHPERNKKIIETMQKRLDMADRDVFLFLGNFRGIMYNFGLMGSYSAPAIMQPSLFA